MRGIPPQDFCWHPQFQGDPSVYCEHECLLAPVFRRTASFCSQMCVIISHCFDSILTNETPCRKAICGRLGFCLPSSRRTIERWKKVVFFRGKSTLLLLNTCFMRVSASKKMRFAVFRLQDCESHRPCPAISPFRLAMGTARYTPYPLCSIKSRHVLSEIRRFSSCNPNRRNTFRILCLAGFLPGTSMMRLKLQPVF